MKTVSIIQSHQCNGCSRCCEGFLNAEIYGFNMSLNDGPCRFLIRDKCGIYPVRPELCKKFLCGWRENTSFPEFMKPNLSNIILLNKYIENFFYYRMVKCNIKIKQEVYNWAEQESMNGKHFIGYDNDGNPLIYSTSDEFKKLIQDKELL